MKNTALPIAIALVIMIALFLMNTKQDSLPPIKFDGQTYHHADSTNIDNIRNHLFTLNGSMPDTTDNYIQIVDYSHQDLTRPHVDAVKKQLSEALKLKPVSPGSPRYFGVFEEQHPIYAIDRDKRFIIFARRAASDQDEDALRSGAGNVIARLEEMKVGF